MKPVIILIKEEGLEVRGNGIEGKSKLEGLKNTRKRKWRALEA